MGYTDVETVRLVLSSDAEETGGTAADLSDPQIQFEIDSSQAIVDSYLATTYNTPFTGSVPFLIKSICTDIAAYRADLNFRKSREYDSENMPIIRRYKAAMAMLQDLRKGVQTLSVDRDDALSGGSIVVHQYELPIFDLDPDSVNGPGTWW